MVSSNRREQGDPGLGVMASSGSVVDLTVSSEEGSGSGLFDPKAVPIDDVVCTCSYHTVWLVVALYLRLSVDPPSIDSGSMDKKFSTSRMSYGVRGRNGPKHMTKSGLSTPHIAEERFEEWFEERFEERFWSWVGKEICANMATQILAPPTLKAREARVSLLRDEPAFILLAGPPLLGPWST
mmetsp:Transcript_26784/g.62230  ORF Transcript_26784/g.62230 Transcript_26784/m.62230 type:complete len:182 (+) Transcript_26784:363-908(+)